MRRSGCGLETDGDEEGGGLDGEHRDREHRRASHSEWHRFPSPAWSARLAAWRIVGRSAGHTESMPTDVAVEAVDLSLAHGPHSVLDTATFSLPAGAVTSLVGPNGAGKSSLLNAIVGLMPLRAGTLRVLGAEPAAVRRRIAYVMQSAKVDEQLPVTVRETVAMGRFADRGAFGRLDAVDRGLVDRALERLEIADLARRHLHELSGGQRQRVFVAQGLAQAGDLLLLDEPVTGLDLVSRRCILDVVDEERAAGRTIVMTTHDLSEAAATDHVVLLAGRVVADGPPTDVLTADHLADAYGGRLLRLTDGLVLIDDPHHHAPGHDHELCEDDDDVDRR